METTLARLIQDGNRFGMQTSGSEPFRERTFFALDRLDKLSYIQGPKFVFVHIIAPHPPYVFGPTGGPVEPADVGTTQTEEGASHYRDQAIYIYYLPDVNASIDPTITPVNTFRVIFNTYFGEDLEVLDDISLYSDYTDPFNFRTIPNSSTANN